MPHMASVSDTLKLFENADDLLIALNDRLAYVAIAGTLTPEQEEHLRFAWHVVDGLRCLFADERQRQGGRPAPHRRAES